MGFGSRIGSFFRGAADRIGQLSVHSVLNRVGQIASAGHKVGSLVNAVTGGALTNLSNHVIGKGATDAIGKGIGYGSRMYDQSLMAKAVLNTRPTASAGPAGSTPQGGGSGAMTQNLKVR